MLLLSFSCSLLVTCQCSLALTCQWFCLLPRSRGPSGFVDLGAGIDHFLVCFATQQSVCDLSDNVAVDATEGSFVLKRSHHSVPTAQRLFCIVTAVDRAGNAARLASDGVLLLGEPSPVAAVTVTPALLTPTVQQSASVPLLFGMNVEVSWTLAADTPASHLRSVTLGLVLGSWGVTVHPLTPRVTVPFKALANGDSVVVTVTNIAGVDSPMRYSAPVVFTPLPSTKSELSSMTTQVDDANGAGGIGAVPLLSAAEPWHITFAPFGREDNTTAYVVSLRNGSTGSLLRPEFTVNPSPSGRDLSVNTALPTGDAATTSSYFVAYASVEAPDITQYVATCCR